MASYYYRLVAVADFQSSPAPKDGRCDRLNVERGYADLSILARPEGRAL